MSAVEPAHSPQEQLRLLDADRAVLRGRAVYPFWYWATWSLAVNWQGLIAVVPNPPRWWLLPVQLLMFTGLITFYSFRRVKVPRPPQTWPTRREWLVLALFVPLQAGGVYMGVRHELPWLITATSAFSAIALAVFAHRTQRVVFRDER